MWSSASRRRPRLRALGLALWMALLGRTTVAGATAGPRSTDMELNTAGCGSLTELNRQIERRSSHIQLVAPSGPGRGMKAEIKGTSAGRREVVLTIVQASGQPLSRRVEVQSCDEAMEALALLIVLALDPDAVTGPAATKGPAPSPRTRAPNTVGSNTARPPATVERSPASPDRADTRETGPAPPEASPAPTPSVSPERAPAPPAVPKEEPPSTVVATAASAKSRDASEAGRTLLVGGASGLAIAGPTPRTMVGGSLYAIWGWDRGSPWSPAIAIGVGRSERGGLMVPDGGTASFALTALQLELCPLFIGMHRPLGARACAMGTVGALSAEGTQTLAPEVHQKVFVLLGGSVSVSYEPGWRVTFVASGGLGVPLQRYAFQFDPSVFYRAAPVAATASLGVGFRFY